MDKTSNLNSRCKDFCNNALLGCGIAFSIFVIVTLAYIEIPHYWHLNEYGDYIGGIAAIISIIFLYLTLRYQNNSFQHNRFETTFFNLLGNQRKLTESMSLTSVFLDSKFTKEQSSFKGRECFQYALFEIERIFKALKSSKYEGLYDEEDDEETLLNTTESDYNENVTKKKIQEMEYWYLCRFYNGKYNITKEIYDKCAVKFKAACDTDVYMMSIYLFSQKNKPYFEHYERSLAQILRYVCENDYGKKHVKEYIRFVVAQMPNDELTFIQYHASVCKPFNKLFENSRMAELLKPTI